MIALMGQNNYTNKQEGNCVALYLYLSPAGGGWISMNNKLSSTGFH